jgi:hypothetical protein
MHRTEEMTTFLIPVEIKENGQYASYLKIITKGEFLF